MIKKFGGYAKITTSGNLVFYQEAMVLDDLTVQIEKFLKDSTI